MPALRNAESIKATSMGNFSRSPVRRKSRAKAPKSGYSPNELREIQKMVFDGVPADEAARRVIAQRPAPEPELDSED